MITDVFKYDPNYEEIEEKYKLLSKEILNSDEEDGSESDDDEDDESGDSDDENKETSGKNSINY